MPGRIVIADDVPTHRIILKARLSAAAYDVTTTASGAETLAVAQADPPDLIILADSLSGHSGKELCRRLKANPATAMVPIILLCDQPPCSTRLAGLQNGADVVMDRMPEDRLLRARIRNLMHRRASEEELARAGTEDKPFMMAEAGLIFVPPGQIAIIAPSLSEGLRWRNELAVCLRDRITVLDPRTALLALSREPTPDAVIIAENPSMPGEAITLLSDLRCQTATLRAAIIVIQDSPSTEHAIMALDLGVSDMLHHGFNAPELAMVLRRELARKSRDDKTRAALKDGLRLAATDPLTGLYNRRYALSQLTHVGQLAAETGEEFAVLVLDLDRFKRINDLYGHASGDAVLIELSARMERSLRRDDFLARIGGEEFLAVIRNCDLLAAQTAAERLRAAVASEPVELPGGRGSVPMTLSIGLVIGSRTSSCDATTLIDWADRGLYSAKADGRNQVTVSKTAA